MLLAPVLKTSATACRTSSISLAGPHAATIIESLLLVLLTTSCIFAPALGRPMVLGTLKSEGEDRKLLGTAISFLVSPFSSSMVISMLGFD